MTGCTPMSPISYLPCASGTNVSVDRAGRRASSQTVTSRFALRLIAIENCSQVSTGLPSTLTIWSPGRKPGAFGDRIGRRTTR